MSRPGQSTPDWKAWLLLAVGLWAFLVPSWALVPGQSDCGAKNRTWGIFAQSTILRLASPLATAALASGKVACGYENRVDPNCCGEQWDQDLGLYYNRARYLNTDSGRFWNQDEYEGQGFDPASLHKYAYAGGNPVFYSDPTGNFSLVELSIVGATIGTVALVAVPAANKLVAGAVGWLADNPDGTKRYSLSRLGVYDESVPLLADLGLTPLDFSENLLQGAMTHLGQDAASATLMGGAFKGVSSGIAAFRRAKAAESAGPELFKDALGTFKNSDLTNAGRALTKHPEVVDATKATLRQVLRTDPQINSAAAEALKSILRNGVRTTPTLPRYGPVIQYQIPYGFGARWTQAGEFIGFINP